MATLNVSLTEPLDRFVQDRVVSGEFQDAGEVVRAGLAVLKRRSERERRKLERLRAAIQIGQDEIERGEGEVIEDLDAWVDRIEAEANRS